MFIEIENHIINLKDVKRISHTSTSPKNHWIEIYLRGEDRVCNSISLSYKSEAEANATMQKLNEHCQFFNAIK